MPTDGPEAMAKRWAAEGQPSVLELGSGMPTQGHFHSVMPTARVLYSDNEPVAVSYAREIVGDNPAVAYIEADVRQFEPLLRAAEQHFHGECKVAIGFIGVAYFIDDESLSRVTQTLHDLAAPGCVMALSHAYTHGLTEHGRQFLIVRRRHRELFKQRARTALACHLSTC